MPESEDKQRPSASTVMQTKMGNNPPRPKAASRQRAKLIFLCLFAVFFFVYLSLSVSLSNEQTNLYTIQNKTVLKQMRQLHLEKVASTFSRAYPQVSPSTWCIDAALRNEQSKRRPMGLCYLKIPRAASSTFAGVNKRIARNFAIRQGLEHSCIRHDGHVPGMYYHKRHQLSFLWASVRDPASRAISRVGYTLSERRPHELQNESVILKALTDPDLHYGTVSEGRGGFQLQYSMLTIIDEYSAWNSSNPTSIIDPSMIKKHVAQVVDRYDFLAVAERLDESLVALQLLLGLETYDILHFATKMDYERKSVRYKKKTFQCVKLQRVNVTGQVGDFLESTEWFARNYGDYLLYTAANQSLDKTILGLGRPKFDAALAHYRSLQKQAHDVCSPQVFFPCSSNGTDQYHLSKHNCYVMEEGCGYPCFDDMYLKASSLQANNESEKPPN